MAAQPQRNAGVVHTLEGRCWEVAPWPGAGAHRQRRLVAIVRRLAVLNRGLLGANMSTVEQADALLSSACQSLGGGGILWPGRAGRVAGDA